jgi:hypothetical protein
MTMLWFRLRVAPRLEKIGGQIAVGVIATGLASAVFPSAPIQTPSNPKITQRIEPERPAAESPAAGPMLAEANASETWSQPASTAVTHATPKAAPKPRKIVMTLPPVRPRDVGVTADPAAPVAEPVVSVGEDNEILSGAPAAGDLTWAVWHSPGIWAQRGQEFAAMAALRAGALVGALRFGP